MVVQYCEIAMDRPFLSKHVVSFKKSLLVNFATLKVHHLIMDKEPNLFGKDNINIAM